MKKKKKKKRCKRQDRSDAQLPVHISPLGRHCPPALDTTSCSLSDLCISRRSLKERWFLLKSMRTWIQRWLNWEGDSCFDSLTERSHLAGRCQHM